MNDVRSLHNPSSTSANTGGVWRHLRPCGDESSYIQDGVVQSSTRSKSSHRYKKGKIESRSAVFTYFCAKCVQILALKKTKKQGYVSSCYDTLFIPNYYSYPSSSSSSSSPSSSPSSSSFSYYYRLLAPYLTDKVQHTALYKTNKNVNIKTSQLI